MMINTFEVRKQEDIDSLLRELRSGSGLPEGVIESVQMIIDDVGERGDAALVELTERYDGVRLRPGELEVTAGERKGCLASLDANTRAAMEKAASRISGFARRALAPEWEAEVEPGVRVGQVQRAVESAGIYAPGGRFAYPSTVLMTGVPAREAGVGRIEFCIPPDREGSVKAASLAATCLVGECRVFRVGGAQAMAAMALGTETVPAVSMLAGPGNVYVTAAKRLLSGVVGIDLEAGPSEVAILIDDWADPRFAAADLLAQLEHDPLSMAVLVCETEGVLESAASAVERMAGPGGWTGIGEDGLRGAVTIARCASREIAVELINSIAPEHLELMVENPSELIGRIESAGCVFLGPYSPVALGDYIAGPSHVLPTGGTAARRSGLSAQSFRKTMNVIGYSRQGLEADSADAVLLARLEGLERHARSIEMRETEKP